MVIKLKPGWRLDPIGSAFRRGARRVPLLLPAGVRLMPALAVQPVPHPTMAERELARFVQLHHPGPDEAALALARSWPCVERATISR